MTPSGVEQMSVGWAWTALEFVNPTMTPSGVEQLRRWDSPGEGFR